MRSCCSTRHWTELKRRYGFQDFALAGFSSGGAIVANLLALRNDIRCAVIASAPTRPHANSTGGRAR